MLLWKRATPAPVKNVITPRPSRLRPAHLLRTAALLAGLALPVALHAGSAQSRLRVEDVPTFQLRARVTAVGGAAPRKLAVRLDVPGARFPAAPLPVTVGQWTDWMPFGRAQA